MAHASHLMLHDAVEFSWVDAPVESYINMSIRHQLDPENRQFEMETHLPSPMTGRVYVSLPEGSFNDYAN